MSTTRIYQSLRVGVTTLITSAFGVGGGAISGAFSSSIYCRDAILAPERAAMGALGNGLTNAVLGMALGAFFEMNKGPLTRNQKVVAIACVPVLVGFYSLQVAGDCLGYILLQSDTSEQMTDFIHDIARTSTIVSIAQFSLLSVIFCLGRSISAPNNQIEQNPELTDTPRADIEM